ncbi:hypothetical protein HAX54_024929, partial [Datura stramonium]|nr:hypothetical protein [Datura stramonium]
LLKGKVTDVPHLWEYTMVVERHENNSLGSCNPRDLNGGASATPEVDDVDVGSGVARKTNFIPVATPVASQHLFLLISGHEPLCIIENPDNNMATITTLSSSKASSPPVGNSRSRTTAHQNFAANVNEELTFLFIAFFIQEGLPSINTYANHGRWLYHFLIL